MTVHGTQASGCVSASGQSRCSVTGAFQSNSPAISGTGFGLYAASYSAMFDNLTATTVSPYITSTGFSNSFYQNGSPGPSIHNALAGTAQLQNGTGSAPIETYYSYTPAGRLYQAKQLHNSPSAQWLSITSNYDNFGNLKSLTDARGNQTSYGYSAKYQSAYVTSVNETLIPGGTLISKRYSYNFTMGTQISSVDPLGRNTTMKYDILGRVVKITYATGDYESYSYNDQANYVNITNENGWKTQQSYDGLGRLSTVERFSGGRAYSTQSSTYNWQDRIATVTDTLGDITRYQYDALGRGINVTMPGGNSLLTDYNDLASWVRTTDQSQVFTCRIYDRAGRLISVIENANSACYSGIVTNYYYDEVGDLVRITTATFQSTVYSYDNLNRIVKTSYQYGTAESYGYDNNGNIVSKSDRNGVQTSYSYDSLNRVQVVKYYGTTVTNDTYTYDGNSNLVKLQSENATLSYSYDPRNRVTCEKYAVNGATSITGPCGTGGGGSVAAGTLITLANKTSVPLHRLSGGMELLSYNVIVFDVFVRLYFMSFFSLFSFLTGTELLFVSLLFVCWYMTLQWQS